MTKNEAYETMMHYGEGRKQLRAALPRTKNGVRILPFKMRDGAKIIRKG